MNLKEYYNKIKKVDKIICFLFLFVFLYILIFSYYTILRHNSFDSGAWDLGAFEQGLWKTIHGGTFFKGFEDPVSPTGSFFAVHFSPILLLILPVYYFHQAPETLLILQTIIIALGAIPLFFQVKEQLKRGYIALTFALIYLLYPPLHGVNWFDFHTEAFLPIFFFLTFYYFNKKNWKLYFIFMFLLLSITEGAAINVTMIGIFGLLMHRNKIAKLVKNRGSGLFQSRTLVYSFITILVAASWMFFSLKILNFFSLGQIRPILRWPAEFGDNIPSMIIGVLSNPLYALEVIFTPFNLKMLYMFILFSPLFFLPLFSKKFLFLCIPWLVIFLLSYNSNYWTAVGFQYPAFLVGPIFVSAIYGYKTLTRILMKAPKLHYLHEKVGKKVLFFMILINIVLTYIWSPIGYGLYIGNSGRPESSLYNNILNEVINLIPPNASVSTQNNLLPHLTRRLRVYPYLNQSNIDYVLIDRRTLWSSGWIPSDVPHNVPLYDDVFPEPEANKSYGLYASIDWIYLFKKGYAEAPITLFNLTKNHGLQAKFYQNGYKAESIVLDLNGDWQSLSPHPAEIKGNSSYKIVFIGFLNVFQEGEYTFNLDVKGNASLTLKNEKENFNMKIYTDINATESINFPVQGFYEITVEYTNEFCTAKNCFEGFINLRWRRPGSQRFETISYENFYIKKTIN